MTNPFHYMLRRNLPLWKVEETVEETVAFCRENGVGEIIWKIDAEEFNHGFTPPAVLEKYIDALRYASGILREKNIIFSINPWLTLNHAPRNRYPDGAPDGFRWRIDSKGKEYSDMACPLSPKWREWLINAYRAFAETKPNKLWVEDDFKTFVCDSADIGCFCEEHLRRFADGMPREQFVAAISHDAALRKRWIDGNASVMLEICRELERTVHGISPETRLGLMCSWSSDSRWWKEAVTILAGGKRPLTRTSLAAYQDTVPSDIIPDGCDFLKESAAIPENAENGPELEDFPYTAYSKSAAETRAEILLAAFNGCTGITMNLFDMVGSPMSEDRRYGRMLRGLKPRLDAIAALGLKTNGRQCGVSIPFRTDYADYFNGDVYNCAFDGDHWLPVLAGSGIPAGINLPDANVVAFTGLGTDMFSDAEVLSLLKGSVILDGACAASLLNRGFGEFLGIAGCQRHLHGSLPLGAERCDSGYMSLWMVTEGGDEGMLAFTPAEDAVIASNIVNWRHEELFPGWLLFENRFGGRVAVYCAELRSRIHRCFMNWRRRAQIQGIVSWLCRDDVPLMADGGAWMYPVCWNLQDSILIQALNFDLDEWDNLKIRFSCGFENPVFRLLGADGAWSDVTPESIERNGTTVSASFSVHCMPLDGICLQVLPLESKEFK